MIHDHLQKLANSSWSTDAVDRQKLNNSYGTRHTSVRQDFLNHWRKVNFVSEVITSENLNCVWYTRKQSKFNKVHKKYVTTHLRCSDTHLVTHLLVRIFLQGKDDDAVLQQHIFAILYIDAFWISHSIPRHMCDQRSTTLVLSINCYIQSKSRNTCASHLCLILGFQVPRVSAWAD